MARKLTNEFSWKNATFMAKLAHAAYMGPEEFKKIFYKQWGDGIEFFSKGGTECYVLHCDKNYIITFRGTEPTSWEDIKADIQFTKQEKYESGELLVSKMTNQDNDEPRKLLIRNIINQEN